VLGDGPPAVGADINRAWQLVVRTTALWLAAAGAVAALIALAPLIGSANA
jgi:adenosylcobinamide-phosphate synthase